MARVLSSVHAISTTCSLCWTSLCAACLYIITRPDRFLCTRLYILWFSVAWGSATFWWQSNACNCSTFWACTWSGSPAFSSILNLVVLHGMRCMRWAYYVTCTPICCSSITDCLHQNFKHTSCSFVGFLCSKLHTGWSSTGCMSWRWHGQMTTL